MDERLFTEVAEICNDSQITLASHQRLNISLLNTYRRVSFCIIVLSQCTLKHRYVSDKPRTVLGSLEESRIRYTLRRIQTSQHVCGENDRIFNHILHVSRTNTRW